MKIFITGVSSGVGLATAELLSREGHEVWGIGRREFKPENFNYSRCDVADPGQVYRVVQEMQAKNFLPDIVVLGSAVFPKDLEAEFDYSRAKQAFEINYLGALVWVENFLPAFLKRGYGKFVAISSTSAFRPDFLSLSLPSSKAALSMAFRGLRLRYAQHNIKFVNIYLGPVATPIVPEYVRADGEPKYVFVISAKKAARKIKKAIFGKRQTYFIPFWVTLLFRLTLLLPDRFFARISRTLKS